MFFYLLSFEKLGLHVILINLKTEKTEKSPLFLTVNCIYKRFCNFFLSLNEELVCMEYFLFILRIVPYFENSFNFYLKNKFFMLKIILYLRYSSLF